MSVVFGLSAPIAQAIAANLNPLSLTGLDGAARLLPGISRLQEPIPTFACGFMATFAPEKKPWHALAVGALVRIGVTTAGAWGLVRVFFG